MAIARAVANAPLVLLADEPTGNLDPTTASYVFEALAALVRQSGLAALIATHNHELAAAHGPPRHAGGRQGRAALKQSRESGNGFPPSCGKWELDRHDAFTKRRTD